MSKKNKRKNKSSSLKQPVVKAGNENVAVNKLRLSEIGSSALSYIMAESACMMVEELRWPQLIMTVETMKLDATVSTALDTKYVFVTRAFNDFKVTFNKESKESEAAAQLIEYNLRNLANGQSLRDIAQSAATFNEYGFSVFEKVYRKQPEGMEYSGKILLDKLSFRPQSTLSRETPFMYDEKSRQLTGVRQRSCALVNYKQNITGLGLTLSGALPNTSGNDVVIPANKVVVMTMSGTEANPAGVSPLIGCYRAFREKILIENLEVVGCSKDLGGIIELKIPSSVLNNANRDPNSLDAQMVNNLMMDAANAHSGEQSFFILPSDYSNKGSPQYSMTLKGIDGGGKQYKTSDLIVARKKAILDRFGAGFINVGNDGEGANNLSESKQTTHGYFVERDIQIITEAFNKNIIPQILALNGIRLSDKDMPKLKTGATKEIDMETFSKFIHRIGTVGYLPKTPAVINKILEVGGFNEVFPDDMDLEELWKLCLGTPTESTDSDTGVGGDYDGLKPGAREDASHEGASAIRDNTVTNPEN